MVSLQSNGMPADGKGAYIGIGANLGDARSQVMAAIEDLALIPRTTVAEVSSLYSSRPMGPAGQPDYVNAVARLDTLLQPHSLLRELQAIEQRFGRRRDGIRWGARSLDLDILLYAEATVGSDRLTIPHPGICERDFVLLPLVEIAPDVNIPGLGTAACALESLDASSLYVL